MSISRDYHIQMFFTLILEERYILDNQGQEALFAVQEIIPRHYRFNDFHQLVDGLRRNYGSEDDLNHLRYLDNRWKPILLAVKTYMSNLGICSTG